jgi:hypothetical protein
MYAFALGLDRDSHEEVKALFSAELESFWNGLNVASTFHHGGMKRNLLVYLELLASLQEKPER